MTGQLLFQKDFTLQKFMLQKEGKVIMSNYHKHFIAIKAQARNVVTMNKET